MGKKVSVNLPDKVWGRLASIADIQGVRVEDVLAHAVAVELGHPRPRFDPNYKPVFEDPLAELDYELWAAKRSGFRVPRREAS